MFASNVVMSGNTRGFVLRMLDYNLLKKKTTQKRFLVDWYCISLMVKIMMPRTPQWTTAQNKNMCMC